MIKPLGTIRDIFKGVYNYFVFDLDIEEIAEYRMDMCYACLKYDRDGKDCLVPGTGPCCSSCGCSLEFKVRSMSTSCPEGVWGAEILEDK